MPQAGDREEFNGDVAVTAPTGGYTAGLVYQLASGAYAVARQTVAAGASCLMALLVQKSVWITKLTGTGKSFSVGTKVYRDASTGKAAVASTGNVLIGVAVEAAGTTATKVLVFGTILPVTAT